ncbi:MAG: di-trans,poly-cis-decaprenylcistransferase, partial [Planctomycetes bacterium]|nr:di-trans,poly-cis-decaprenylcistransferase [Planctomycetota bacterium]
MTEESADPRVALSLTPAQFPRHIAIIMDGNGRWAENRGWPRIRGHERGAQTVRTIVTHCAKLGIEALTLYSFSTENWKRPKEEVDFLMGLYVKYLIAERKTIMDNQVRFLHIGRRAGLPESVLAEMDQTVAMSRDNAGLKLCLALNYGARDEITDAVRDIAKDVKAGRLDPDEINESLVSNALYTAGLPDPDLMIRTANERRLSNFLLWQLSYAEIHVSEKLWPDFSTE